MAWSDEKGGSIEQIIIEESEGHKKETYQNSLVVYSTHGTVEAKIYSNNNAEIIS